MAPTSAVASASFSSVVDRDSDPRGKRVHADTLAYEVANNSDQINPYGVDNPSQCVIDAFTAAGFRSTIKGQVDSHGYSVTSFGHEWVVADVGANALLKVDNRGHVRTLAVLPPQPTEIIAEMAEALGLPSCVAGVTYSFEPIEVGKDGLL